MRSQTLRWTVVPTGLVVVVLYALAIRLLQAAAIDEPMQNVLVIGLGIPLWYLVNGLLCGFAHKVLAHVARGLADEPMEGETDVNPFQRGMAWKLSLVMVLVFGVLAIDGRQLTPLWLAFPVLAFPLLWLGLLAEESLLGALDPERLWRTFTGLGLWYPVVAALISIPAGFLAYATLWLHDLFVLLAAAFGFLVAHALTGEILYSRRSALDLETVKSPEQTRAAELIAEARSLDDFFHKLHRLCEGGHFREALEKLEAHIGDRAEAYDPVIHERLVNFQDQRLMLEHALNYLHRLAVRGERRKAWALLKWCVGREPRFRPLDGATLLDLTRAAGPEDAGLVNELLADFADVYPESAARPDALFRRARVCIERLNDRATGTALIAELLRLHPDFAATKAFIRYRARLESH